ncbi:MAG: MltA domain-containing protein [Deltaproteobacteria bacterium]|nr:MAG: MltA domain-containing protein [Deltaproteobacteria bacterium]
MFQVYRCVSALIIFLIIGGCYPLVKKEVKEPAEALKRVRYFWPKFYDDMDKDSLELAIERDLEYLNRLEDHRVFTYGPDKFTVEHIRDSLRTFSQIIKQNSDIKKFNRELRKKFFLYKAAGWRGDKKALFTGYFEPIINGNLEPDSIHLYPIYKRPDDLLRIDLGLFRPKFHGEYITARVDGQRLIPYYTRRDIAEGKVLEGQGLEIAWLKDPLDIAILQIQGSGIIKLPSGDTIRVGYSASNGHPYKSIGRYMIDKGYITADDLSLQTIRSYLDDYPDIKEEILNYNPSYVFFRSLENGPFGNIGVPLTPGRSLALDDRLFPKGALVFICCQKPTIEKDGKIAEWTPFCRFLLNQDTGGAIKGAGRADIFWGSDPYAEVAAGHLKHEGELYFLVKKPDF